MESTPWWVQVRLYLTLVVLLLLAVVVGLNFAQRTRFWWFGVHEVATAWFLLAALALGFVLGLAAAWWWGRRRAG
ncbi:hypothetical protein [Oceanithermus sp.]